MTDILRTLAGLSDAYRLAGDLEMALRFGEEAEALAWSLEARPWTDGLALHLGALHAARGAPWAALAYLQHARARGLATGNRSLAAAAALNAGQLLGLGGLCPATAYGMYQAALDLAEDYQVAVLARQGLAMLHLRANRTGLANAELYELVWSAIINGDTAAIVRYAPVLSTTAVVASSISEDGDALLGEVADLLRLARERTQAAADLPAAAQVEMALGVTVAGYDGARAPEHFQRAIALGVQAGDHATVACGNYLLAQALFRLRRLVEAHVHAQAAAQYAAFRPLAQQLIDEIWRTR